MSEIDELLNVSLPDTDERGEEEENGREILINVINQGKENLLPGKTPWIVDRIKSCLLYTSPSPRDKRQSRMPSSA